MISDVTKKFIENGYLSIPFESSNLSPRNLLPMDFIQTLEKVMSDEKGAAELWRQTLDSILIKHEASILFTNFAKDNVCDFTDFYNIFDCKGDGKANVSGAGLDLIVMPHENVSLTMKNVPSTEEIVLHMLAEFPSNIENNFYLKFNGENSISFRFGNDEISIAEIACVLQHNNDANALFSFSVNSEYVSLYINGLLLKRKKFYGDRLSLKSITIELVGHDSADLTASIHGVEIWSSKVPFQGVAINQQEIQHYRFEQLIKLGDIESVYDFIVSYDDLDVDPYKNDLKDILEKDIETCVGYKEWIYEGILNALPIKDAGLWREKWSSKLPSPIIEVDNLSVLFYRLPNERLSLSRILFKREAETFDVLKNINFQVYPGDILGVIGVNGAGKSTLLRALSGLLPIQEGEIILRGKHLLLTPGLGIRDELSGKDNIYLACTFMGLNLKQTKLLYDEIVSFSELEKSIDQPFKFYSDGMKSRLIFSIATNVAPDILMLDELLNAGDIKFQQKAAKRMDDLIGKTKVVIVVTHSIPFVAEKCNKALLISNGQQLCYGDTSTVIARYFNELHMTNPSRVGVQDNVAMMQHIQTQSFLPGTGGNI